jgi:N-methylhydantoinase B
MNPLVKLELVRESLIAVVNEMRANVIHASYSSVIYEGHDFSCALMTGDGRQIAQGVDDHPLHIFAVPWSTRAVLATFGDEIADGDAFLHNDPYTGGTHLNDILLLKPVFAGGKLIFFAAIRAHWNDVGGMTAGSLSGAVTEVFQEGIRIPPIRIVERGRPVDAVLALLFANMRLPHERQGDYRTMIGAAEKAAEHIHRLVARYGLDELLTATDELMQRSETRMRERIAAIPAGEYLAEGYVESSGQSTEPLAIRLRLVVGDGELFADFTGSSPQVAGATNVGPALAPSAVFTIAKAFLDPKVPINHGSFAPIKVLAPEGSFINARYPAPCGGMAEVKFLIESVVAGAFSQALSDRSVGDLKGGANHTHIAGFRPASGERFILYEWPAGGTGASDGTDGSNAVRTYTEGDFNSIQSAEAIEAAFPLRVERCEIRQGSCGDGKFRGGFGLRREIRVLCQMATLSVLSEKNVIAPYGVAGGRSSWPNRFRVVRDGIEIEPSRVPGKVSGFALRAGDIVRSETAGGGGFGDPLDRDPERVRQDVCDGYLNRRQVRERYGVVLGKTLAIDGATGDERSRLRRARRSVTLRELDGATTGVRRVAVIGPGLAAALGAEKGGLFEVVAGRGAPLRCWATILPGIADDVLLIGRDAMTILGVGPDGRAQARTLLPADALGSAG